MTDDQTQQYDTNPAGTPPAGGTPPADGTPPAVDASPASEAAISEADMAAPAAAAPVTAVAAGGASRARWFVALGVAVVAIGAAIGALLLLNAPKTPEALAYVPADAALVVELRPELPGDQLQNLGNFLAKFPGFADQSTLEQKLDEAFSRLLASNPGGLDYRTDVKPWLNGPAFLAIRPAAQASTTEAFAMPAGVIVSATTTGQVTCAAALEGQTTSTQTHNGTELLVISGSEFACAIQGRQGLLGDLASVKAALDAKANGTGMDKVAAYTKARASLKAGDRLATMYFDFKRYMDVLSDVAGAAPGASNPFDALNVPFPDWGMVGIRAEGDAIVMDSVVPPPAAPAAGATLLPAVPAHASNIAGLVPADAAAFVEAQGAGVSLQNLVNQLRTIPEVDQQLKLLDGMASIDTLVGWIQDAGIVVTGGDAPNVSLILLAADDAAAAQMGGSISTVLGLAAMGGQGIQVRDETVNGVKITTLTITDLGALTGGAAGVPTTGPVQVSFAVKGRALMVGVGDGAVAKLVNVQAGSTLADDAAFKKVAARGVSPSATTVYVAIPKLVALLEANVPASDLTEWNTSIKPYIAPFEALYFVSEADGDLAESTAILSVKSN